ncbi:MAG: histidinol dehydrogenase [Planctomycetes bacterium RBG_13_60_9]|nr:MAG: histidinol dehydrogenase [Planctomycetes bacterium RBG_13_60_9]
MSRRFDEILILSSQPDANQRIDEVLKEKVRSRIWLPDDPRYGELETITQDVVRDGDAAVARYTEKFDGVRLAPEEFRVSQDELQKAHSQLSTNLLRSIRQAIANVRKYQSEIFVGNCSTLRGHPGIRYTPIQRVGICVPGASAPLPSTVIMTAVPAQVAGVRQIVVVSPPRVKGSIHPVILAVCSELGLQEVYRIGGAQAVIALANGTETIKKVWKIVGPGNQWVQMAKARALPVVGIDSLAGPSEVLIIANQDANPAWVAADMLSQAEHDPGSAFLFTDSQVLAENVLWELERQVDQLNRSEATTKCLRMYSRIILFDNMDQVIAGANAMAPEHLEIQCGAESRAIAQRISDAGAIFIGDYTPVAVGDYWAGPSHTLPTGSTAKFYSPLSANDFIKSTSIIEYSAEQLAAAADDIIRLAEVEGLDAHARSVKIRRQQ